MMLNRIRFAIIGWLAGSRGVALNLTIRGGLVVEPGETIIARNVVVRLPEGG